MAGVLSSSSMTDLRFFFLSFFDFLPKVGIDHSSSAAGSLDSSSAVVSGSAVRSSSLARGSAAIEGSSSMFVGA